MEKEAKRAAQAAVKQQQRALSPPGSKPLPGKPMTQLEAPANPDSTNVMDTLLSDLKSDTLKDTIKAHRSKRMAPAPPNPAVAAEAMTVVLRKTGGPGPSALRA